MIVHNRSCDSIQLPHHCVLSVGVALAEKITCRWKYIGKEDGYININLFYNHI